ncbi:MAG TPA: hypothetical protein VKS79_02920 [Gemmataceae bacterium]|nr:hypothetical protein [Gemmataceae bacterium]
MTATDSFPATITTLPIFPGLVGVRIRARFNCVREIVKIVKKNVNSNLGRMPQIRKLSIPVIPALWQGVLSDCKFEIQNSKRHKDLDSPCIHAVSGTFGQKNVLQLTKTKFSLISQAHNFSGMLTGVSFSQSWHCDVPIGNSFHPGPEQF